MTAHRSLAQDLDAWQNQVNSWTGRYSAEEIGGVCGDVRRWADTQGWPLDECVALDRVLQWWAFDLA